MPRSLASNACWIPEAFEAKVSIRQDGSYAFTYDGVLTSALAAAGAKDRKLSKGDEAKLKELEDEIRQDPKARRSRKQ